MTRDQVEVRNRKAAGKQQPSIEICVQELKLHGFAAYDRYRIGAAVERELTRLFAEQGMPQALVQSFEAAHLDGGAFQASPDSRPEVVGVQIARTLYGGLTR